MNEFTKAFERRFLFIKCRLVKRSYLVFIAIPVFGQSPDPSVMIYLETSHRDARNEYNQDEEEKNN